MKEFKNELLIFDKEYNSCRIAEDKIFQEFWNIYIQRFYMSERSRTIVGDTSIQMFNKTASNLEVLTFLIMKCSCYFNEKYIVNPISSIEEVLVSVESEFSKLKLTDWAFHPFFKRLNLTDHQSHINEIQDTYKNGEGKIIYKFNIYKNKENDDWTIDFFGNENLIVENIKSKKDIFEIDIEKYKFNYKKEELNEIRLLYRENIEFSIEYEKQLIDFYMNEDINIEILKLDSVQLLKRGLNPFYNSYKFNELVANSLNYNEDKEIFEYFRLPKNNGIHNKIQYLTTTETYRILLYFNFITEVLPKNAILIDIDRLTFNHLFNQTDVRSDLLKLKGFHLFNKININIQSLLDEIKLNLQNKDKEEIFDRYVIGNPHLDKALSFYRKTEFINSDENIIFLESNKNTCKSSEIKILKFKHYSFFKNKLKNKIVFLAAHKNVDKIAEKLSSYGVDLILNFSSQRIEQNHLCNVINIKLSDII